MLDYKPAADDQYDALFQLLKSDAVGYLQETLELMKMNWEQFADLFRTVGKVSGIYQDGCLAGFYWIEEREKILHLHGLILDARFRGKGIGTEVLQMLIARYQDHMDAIELGVHQSNVGAIRLYKRLGFEVVTVRDDLGYFIMQKSLMVNPVKAI